MSGERTGCRLAGGLRHYEVVSPVHITHGSYSVLGVEPPEEGCCWVVVEAETPAKAKAAALRTPEFRSWQGEDLVPFRGLKAKLFRCGHGYCMGCVGEPEVPADVDCPDCRAEWERQERQWQAEVEAAS